MYLGSFLASVVVMATVDLTTSVYRPFDCRRPGIECRTDGGRNGRCGADGTCLCDKPFYGFDCSFNNDVVTTSCSVDCGSGRCLKTASGDRCFCGASEYGTNCEYSRVSVTECKQEYMTVNVNPYGDFAGKIYVEMMSATPGCTFQASAAPSTVFPQGYMIQLPLTSDASKNPCASRLTTDKDGHSYKIIVQYNRDYLTYTDEKHTVSCNSQGKVGIVGTVLNSGQLDENDVNVLSGQNTGQSSLDVPVTVSVTGRDDRKPVSSVIRVGDRLNLEVSMETSSNFKDFFVDSCFASNKNILDTSAVISGSDTFQKVLVMDRCPTASAVDVIEGDMSKDGNTVLIPFRGFKFQEFDSVYLSCSVQMCEDTCAAIPCGDAATLTGFGRKRRQTLDDASSVNVSKRVFVVTVGDNTLVQPEDRISTVEKEPCVESVAFITVASVFGIVLTITLAAALVLCLRYMRDQQGRKMVQKA